MKTQIDNQIKYCRECGDELIPDNNWVVSYKKSGNYICRCCYNNYLEIKRMKNNPNYKKQQVNNPIKYCIDCECQLIPDDNWPKSQYSIHSYLCKNCINGRIKKWQKANPKSVKVTKKKSNRKSKAKRKGYGDTELFDNPFPDSIPVVGHHISDGFVVILPRSLHLNHLRGLHKQLHREDLKPYIEGIYDITYIIEEGD